MTPKALRTPHPPADCILGIEAATPAGGVALATTEGRLLAHYWHDSRLPVSERLMHDLDAMLAQHKVAAAQIQAVAVTLGPGAFTGLRVALAIAKTLAEGWGVRLYGLSTLEVLAQRSGTSHPLVCALLDARRGEVYSGLFQVSDEAPQSLREERVEPIDETLKYLETINTAPGVAFTGDGAEVYREQILARADLNPRWIAPPWNRPGADAVALAGVQRWRRADPGIEPLAAAPVYLRHSDAEKRHGIFLTPTGVSVES